MVDQKKLKVSLKSTQEVDIAINNLTYVIQSTACTFNTSKIQYSNVAPSGPEHIRILIFKKRRARALYQRSHLPSQKCIFNNLSNSLKKLFC